MEENLRQLNLIRTFNAPLDKVWGAWTMPDAWVEWYGKPGEVPKDSAQMDLRVGGRWKSTTIAGGETINFTGEYKVIEKPFKLVLTFDNPDDPSDTNAETVTVVFIDLGDGRTEMNFTQKGNLPAEEYQTGLKDGWTGFFDALQKYLEG